MKQEFIRYADCVALVCVIANRAWNPPAWCRPLPILIGIARCSSSAAGMRALHASLFRFLTILSNTDIALQRGHGKFARRENPSLFRG